MMKSTVAYLVAAFVGCVMAVVNADIACYSCSGNSGITSTSVADCGLPFNTSHSPTVTCSGICVTQSIFESGNGGTNSYTAIYRSCSNAPVTPGCVYSEPSGRQQWSCISTCDTDKCNNSSLGSRSVVPPSIVVLLLATVFGSSFRM